MARLFRSGDGPSFGLRYDFRQGLPLGEYAAFYAECPEEIEEGESLDFTGARLSEHHFVDDGYLPSPPVVAAAVAARTRTITTGVNVLLPMYRLGTDRGKPRPGPIREEDRPWERYLVGMPGEVAEGLIELHEEALENLRLFATEVASRVREAAGPKPA